MMDSPIQSRAAATPGRDPPTPLDANHTSATMTDASRPTEPAAFNRRDFLKSAAATAALAAAGCSALPAQAAIPPAVPPRELPPPPDGAFRVVWVIEYVQVPVFPRPARGHPEARPETRLAVLPPFF